MQFGPVPLSAAVGGILAHTVRAGTKVLKKGALLGATEIDTLRKAGIKEVVTARLDPGDVEENRAATQLAQALVPDPSSAGVRLTPASAGRVNIVASRPGLVAFDADAVRALNRVDPGVTCATLPPLTRVTPGLLMATVKIIPYAVPEVSLADARAHAPAAHFHTLPVELKRAGLLLSTVPGQKISLKAKAVQVTADRLGLLGIALVDTSDVPHEVDAMAEGLRALGGDMVLILTGSATSDLCDTAPEAVRRAGGAVSRFGMPVDPGNLLFLGTQGGRPVIGLPGCARSPALNGADWVLERVACGLEVSDDDVADMGVGGLLKEIPTRPRPREGSRQGE